MSRNAAVVRKRAVSNPGDTLRLSEPASSDLGVAGVSTSLSPQLRSPIQQAPTTPDDTSVAQGMNGSLRRRLGGSPAFPDYQTDGPAAPDKLEPAISRRERELSAPASAQVFTSASGFFGKGIRALGQGMGLTGPSAAGKEQVGPKRTWGDSISRAGKIDGMLMPPIKLGSEDNLGKLAGRSLGDADPEEEPTIRVVQSGNIMLEHATTQAREQRANATGDVLTDARAAVRTVWRKPVSTLSFDDPLSPRSGVESTPSTISSISKSTTGEHHDMSFSTRNATPSAARQTFEANRLARAATLAKSTAGAYTSPTRRGSVPPSGSAQSTSYNRRNSQPVVSTPSSSARSSTASPLTSQRRGSRFTEIWSPDQGNNAPLPPIPVEQPSHQYNAVRASQEPSATSLPTQGERMSKQLSAASGFSRDSSRLSAPISPHASVQFSAPGCTRTDSMLSAASAATTLSELGESLRWAHKFPEGRHMSRAMSRASMIGGRRISGLPPGSANASASTLPTLGYSAGGSVAASRASFGSRALAETRNGLRFLAKRRRDVDEDLDAHDALVERPDADQNEVPRPAKWNKFKWILFISVLVLFLYGFTGLVGSLLTWSRTWARADVTVVADTDILIFITLASFLCVLTCVVGLCGVMLNSRPILALYCFLLWPTLVSMLVVGYTSYKRASLRLDRKLNMAWSRYYDDLDRLRLQNNLHCCGFYTPLHQATFSRQCYPRTSLPGCKGKLYRYERLALTRIYKGIFTLVFVHLANILVAMLCSNHVNVTFGKGLTPRQYRLDMTHVRANAVSIMRALSTVGTSAPPSTQHSRVTLVEPPNIAISSASMTNLRPALKRHESSYGSSGKVSFADNADDGDDDLDEKYAEDRYHTHEHHDGAYASRPPVPPRSPGRPAPYAFAQPNAHMESAPHAHAYAPHDSSAGGIRLVGQRSVDAADVRGLGLTLGFPEHAARQLREGHMANLA